MFKKLMIAGFAALPVLVSPALQAEELSRYDTTYNVHSDSDLYSIEEGQGFAYKITQSQEGASLGLFVKKTASESRLSDVTAQELNTIAPAAGIQLTIDFSL